MNISKTYNHIRWWFKYHLRQEGIRGVLPRRRKCEIKACKRFYFGVNSYCKKHRLIVRAGNAKMVKCRSAERKWWAAKLIYLFCADSFIIAKDQYGNLFYENTEPWPEWRDLPKNVKREPNAVEKYMLPVAREKWASLSWNPMRYRDWEDSMHGGEKSDAMEAVYKMDCVGRPERDKEATMRLDRIILGVDERDKVEYGEKLDEMNKLIYGEEISEQLSLMHKERKS